tara:strand:+ start:863 stop:1987 length:1125 start_codon:yes stop_codon:yes gene_type:complete
MNVVAILPPGLEEEGCKELIELGAQKVKSLRRCASFEADMACLYRLYLQARLPFRILREIARFKCNSSNELYERVQKAFEWEAWLNPSMSFRVDVSGSSNGLSHSHYSALQVKNALVDLQRQLWGIRSDIDLNSPSLCLHLHLSSYGAVLSLDGSASSLHRRGYRLAMGSAPLKENLAAGLIRLTGWNGLCPLIDPVCGSATLLIEAASLLNGLSPNLKRNFILQNWWDFNDDIWKNELLKLHVEHQEKKSNPIILGCEKDIAIANQARSNVMRAGLQDIVEIQNRDFKDLEFPTQIGTIVCNPPYGKRIGFDQDLSFFYRELSDFLKLNASEWQLWILSGNPSLTKALRMKSRRKFPISNGGIDCRWLNYTIN